jgi:hypothetical protein
MIYVTFFDVFIDGKDVNLRWLFSVLPHIVFVLPCLVLSCLVFSTSDLVLVLMFGESCFVLYRLVFSCLSCLSCLVLCSLPCLRLIWSWLCHLFLLSLRSMEYTPADQRTRKNHPYFLRFECTRNIKQGELLVLCCLVCGVLCCVLLFGVMMLLFVCSLLSFVRSSRVIVSPCDWLSCLAYALCCHVRSSVSPPFYA